jgi:hypothetical protein
LLKQWVQDEGDLANEISTIQGIVIYPQGMCPVIAQFVDKVKGGRMKGKLEKPRLSHHCHLNGIALSV